MVLIDTGPLVALFDPRDPDHKNCHSVLTKITAPLYTTEAVLTEVLHLLSPGSKGVEGIMDFVMRGYVTVMPLELTMLQRCFELMHKYQDHPMDFADATLMSLAEQQQTDKIFTLDFADFGSYKMKKGHRYYALKLLGRELLE